MRQFIKGIADRTSLGSVYRTLREEWRFSRMQFTDTPLGYRFAGSDDMIAGTFEPEERRLLQEYLADADLFVDIGANVGYFTCLACSLGKQVIAVEPLWSNLQYLYENLHANGWSHGIEIYPVGLADKPGLARLYGGGTGASLVPGWAGAVASFGRTIPLTTLDIILGKRFQHKRIVIKMDVEGAEYNALLGAMQTMKVVPRPIWLIEITLAKHRKGNRNPHFRSTFQLFWSHGYRSVSIGQQWMELHPADVEKYINMTADKDVETDNYLFLHGSNLRNLPSQIAVSDR